MGKSKKGSASKGALSSAPKCTCDHPYNCQCGNRPPRPSKGHKWDPDSQTWGGKGHKQKGASGQTASSAEAAKVTNVGKTQIAQWQRLPSTLLKEYCKQQKRRPPKFKNISKNNDTFLIRLILPDNKDPDKDLFFVPAKGVGNEEQATEEACILALLSQTPNMPHERKLPEPYKTTWLHAIENLKSSTKDEIKKTTAKSSTNNSSTTTYNKNNTNKITSNAGSSKTNGGAQASTSLSLRKSYTSKAERQRQIDEKRRDRNKRIRRHEAIRMANKNHPVFLTASLRNQIQKLLRGELDEEVPDLEELGDDEQEEAADELDDGQAYVMERLHHEGFTKKQIKLALAKKGGNTSANEDKWDSLYEDCLQWLCIYLDEDQLPEGFDPREGNLDVIVPTKVASNSVSSQTSKQQDDDNPQVGQDVAQFASSYGISNREANAVFELASKNKRGREIQLWEILQQAAGVSLATSATKSDENMQTLQEEIEALEAIFPSEFEVKKDETESLLTIKVTDVDTDMTVQVIVENGVYPMAYPKRVLMCGTWPGASLYGACVHVETIKFLSNLESGNPMIFEIYGQVQALLRAVSSGDLPSMPLLPKIGGNDAALANSQNTMPQPTTGRPVDNDASQKETLRSVPRKVQRRPRERSVFWSTLPTKTPAAAAHPRISKSMDQARKSLPAFKARQDFLNALSKAERGGRVMLVTGDTGCGKTTQIPQFILEEAPSEAKIVVAQPRRLAATGVAGRVANERGEDQPGTQSVGYVVRGDSAMCKSSRLVFCTTGVLLRQLQCEGALENISHLIVDEVHERHLDSDVLLGFLKMSLKDYPNLRVVLMSATLDADKFAYYWGNRTPRIHIPGRTFPVADFMLEDVLSMTGYVPPKKKKKHKKWQGSQKSRRSSPWADSERSDEESLDEGDPSSTHQPIIMDASKDSSTGPRHSIPIEDLVKRVDETDLDYDLLAQLVRYLVLNRSPQDDGSILVFLSGAPEINRAIETLKRIGSHLSLLILPLHGGLQPPEQRSVFLPPRNGLTKVIFSTNVAETSITIPDCTIVIDTCREKESSYDPVNRMPLLLEQFASKASLKQRRGRAGRVREGVCYKLISRATYGNLKEHGEPEIRRCALDQTLLSLLFLGVERGSGTFISQLMDPPSQQSVDSAMFSLRKLGAVTSGEMAGEIVLTPLGQHLAGIPAPPSVGKLLVMGSILGCRRAALAMAAGMTIGRSPFLRIDAPRQNSRDRDDDKASTEDMKRERVLEERKALFKKVGNSDHSLLVAAYLHWESASPGGGGRKRFCESLGLSFNGMKDMKQLVNQYDNSLRAAGYVASNESDRNMNSWTIIRACVVSALAPSQLVRVQRPSTKYVETVEGAVEKEGVAKELMFFIRGSVEEQQQEQQQLVGATQISKRDERVFVHPSSLHFAVGSYYCPWLVYHTMVRTSKPFLRDISECSSYALLLFGGDLEVVAKEGVVVIDNWVKLEAKARIGSLIGGLRQKMDELLAKKIVDPSFELANTREMELIVKLLVSDGHG